MAREFLDNHDSTGGEIPPVQGEPIIPTDDLNGAIRAAAGEPEAGSEPPFEKPEIQPGKTPSIEDAFCDMSQPPPAPPVVLLVLDHSPTPPKGAFRVQLRQGDGVFLWMISVPWGESQAGEAFTYPIIASLRPRILLECPALIPVRFEIRLICHATGKFSLLEIRADPLKTQKQRLLVNRCCRWSSAERRRLLSPRRTRGRAGLGARRKRRLPSLTSGPSKASSSWSAPPTRRLDYGHRRFGGPGALPSEGQEDRLKWAPSKMPSARAAVGGGGSSTPSIVRREVGRGRDACAPWICSAAKGGKSGWRARPSRPARSR